GPVGGAVLVAVAVVGGLSVVLAYRRWEQARWLLRIASAGVVVYLVAFLVFSPTAGLLGGDSVEAAHIARPTSPRPIVFLQFDEWPTSTIVDEAGRIDADLYPNLAALAGDGTWYRNATTVATYTNYALPSIVTGRYPEGEALPIAGEYPESLFTLLGEEYEFAVDEVVTELCPPSLCDSGASGAGSALGGLLGDARDAYEVMVSPDPDREVDLGAAIVEGQAPTAAGQGGMFQASDFGLVAQPSLRLETVERFVDGITSGEEPTLHFLHLLLPHQPYRFLPSGEAYEGELASFLEDDPFAAQPQRAEDPATITAIRQRLVLQAQYTDRIVGEVLDRLREVGLYDEAIVVVVADHGVGLQPGLPAREIPSGEEGESLYADQIFVPMIVKGPGIDAGEVSDANVETIDLVPTIADLVGVDLPWAVDGISLVSGETRSAEKRFHIVENPEAGVGGASTPGDPIRIDGGAYQERMLADHVDSFLRSDNPTYRAYAVSDASELLGAPVATAPLGEPSPWRVDVTSTDALADNRPDLGLTPARVSGSVEGPVGEERPTIAIAVNGTISGVVETHALGDDPYRFDTILVPDFIRTGANDVTFFVVSGTEGARVLHPLTGG
ncbi:MAG TPA: sulfatase-like hydrolase/transferase, partial [Acidimicrobiales bacterium]|nr:sulfatase-like hydrolase/transferase [Acidimicrobiales bacterium]